MKSNEEYVKSITSDDKYTKECTDFWVYPNNDKSYGRKVVLDRNKNYVIPAYYIKLASFDVYEQGLPSLSAPRRDSICAMSDGFALDEFSCNGIYLVVRYLGGDRFLVPQINETLFLGYETFADPAPAKGVYEKVIEGRWLAGKDFDEFAKVNPLFINGTLPRFNIFDPLKRTMLLNPWDLEICDFTDEKVRQRLAESHSHVMSTEELKLSFAKAHEKNSKILQEGYQRIQQRNQEDAILLKEMRNELLNMRSINEKISSRAR